MYNRVKRKTFYYFLNRFRSLYSNYEIRDGYGHYKSWWIADKMVAYIDLDRSIPVQEYYLISSWKIFIWEDNQDG